MKVIFVCGGSGGHINPALALADELKRTMPDTEILFVGSGKRMELRLVPQAGYTLENIKVSGLERSLAPKKIVGNIKALGYLVAARRQTLSILKDFKPDIVVGTGGYVCYPVLKAAKRLGLPTLLHESNAVPGLTTSMLSGIVDKILVAFDDVAPLYRNPEKIVFTGTPVRGGFLTETRERARMKLGVDGRPLVVSFWGSLGAEKMNEIIVDFIEANKGSRLFSHIHATGMNEEDTAALRRRVGGEGYPGLPEWIDIRPYIDDMPAIMAACDLAVCRGGASTIAELTYTGTPAVIIPSPYVPNNHQEKNARQLEKTGAAVVLLEKELTGESLYEAVSKLLENKPALSAMSAAMQRAGKRDAAERILAQMMAMI